MIRGSREMRVFLLFGSPRVKQYNGIVNLASGWARQADEFEMRSVKTQGSGLNGRLQTREFTPLSEATRDLAYSPEQNRISTHDAGVDLRTVIEIRSTPSQTARAISKRARSTTPNISPL
jgi:hypothetical protein